MSKRALLYLNEEFLKEQAPEIINHYSKVLGDIVSDQVSGVIIPSTRDPSTGMPIAMIKVFDSEDVLSVYLPAAWLEQAVVLTKEQQEVSNKIKSFVKGELAWVILPISTTIYPDYHYYIEINKIN